MPKTDQHLDIAGLRAGERVDDEIYLVMQKDLRTTANGGMYIHAVLADRTGQIVARLWNATQELYDSMRSDGLLRFRGRVESYKGKPQFIIDGLRSVAPGEVDASAFLPETAHDVEAMWARVLELMRTIQNRDLLALVGCFLNDAVFVEAFKKAPAARGNHHAYLGGLLEHTLNLLEAAELLLPRYPRLSRDLVLAGILLHDAGKTVELSCDTSFNYTDAGQLVGHIVQAATWIQLRAADLERESGQPFPQDLLTALTHLIVSHHGKYEYGSPRLPATGEAFFVHHLDNLDAKLNMVFNAIDKDPDKESRWTQWFPALETRVYKHDPTRA